MTLRTVDSASFANSVPLSPARRVAMEWVILLPAAELASNTPAMTMAITNCSSPQPAPAAVDSSQLPAAWSCGASLESVAPRLSEAWLQNECNFSPTIGQSFTTSDGGGTAMVPSWSPSASECALSIRVPPSRNAGTSRSTSPRTAIRVAASFCLPPSRRDSLRYAG